MKTLNKDNFFNTKVEVKKALALRDLFDTEDTIILKLKDGTWVA